ncbi:MAG: hypothetical protein GF393_05940 [Armatimonadia bacterium]|nr:hypothetical protein [Armatimonadia bacterium]
MRTSLAVLAALVTLTASAAAVGIDVIADPPPAEANLLQNADMEAVEAGEPAHWSFSTAVPENFALDWPEGEGRDGSRALHLVAHENVMSGYWGQVVPVSEGRYVFRGWYRTESGRLLMYAHGRDRDADPPVGVDARTYHGSAVASFLVPVFIPWEALTGPDPDTYYPFSVEVDVPEGLEQITLSMGMYFTPGEAWFDDVWFGPARMSLKLRVSGEGEALEKVTIFQDGVEEPVYVSTDDPACPADEPLPEPFEVTVDAPSGGSFLIVAKTVDGDLHRVRFPGEGQ